MNQLAETKGGAVARTPAKLVPLIKAEFDLAEKAGMPHYAAAGAMLIEAKAQMPSGLFGQWAKDNFKRGETQLKFYMALAKATQGRENAAAADFESIKDFRRRILSHDLPTRGGGLQSPAWQPNLEAAQRAQARLNEMELSRRQERDAQRKLALQIVNIGFKVLATKLHPDKKGGSREAMARLNAVRRKLKDCVDHL